MLPLTECCYSPRAAAYGVNQRYAKIESSPGTHKTSKTLGFPVQIGGVSGLGLSKLRAYSPDALPPSHYPGGALGLPMDVSKYMDPNQTKPNSENKQNPGLSCADWWSLRLGVE